MMAATGWDILGNVLPRLIASLLMEEPWGWRLARAAAMSALFGYAVLALLAIAESIASHEQFGEEWQLGKPEYVSWILAALTFPLFALTPLPLRGWGWGFVRALSPPALVWYLYDLAADVSESLHHSEPIWLDVAMYVAIYIGCVPWVSWRGLKDMRKRDVKPIR